MRPDLQTVADNRVKLPAMIIPGTETKDPVVPIIMKALAAAFLRNMPLAQRRCRYYGIWVLRTYDAFATGWEVESMDEARFEVRPDPEDIQFSKGGPFAWFSVIQRSELA